MPTGFAVRVRRPSINLENFIYVLWQDLAESCSEQHSDLKVYFILYQVVNLL